MTDRRMIEDYIPVAEISEASIREKSGARGNGHLASLHQWWARRPLAASRAAVYATLVPPSSGEDRKNLAGHFRRLCTWSSTSGHNSELCFARRKVEDSYAGERPVVLDMFAGGGAIPLECLRLGADAVAVELNPVAHLIQRCTLEFPQRYRGKLLHAVEKWGNWVIDRTQAEVGDLFPNISLGPRADEQLDLLGCLPSKEKRVLRPVAYLWTRTIPSTARGYESGMVPLVRQTWLSKKKGNFVALRLEVDRKDLRIRFKLVTSSAKTDKGAIEEWGFDPKGQSSRGSTTCPYSGAKITADDAKRAGISGTMARQFLAVACVEPGRRGKLFLDAEAVQDILPNDVLIEKRLGALVRDFGLSSPEEKIAAEDRQHFQAPMYGLDTFGKLFTPRQQLTLLTVCKYIQIAKEHLVREDGETFAAAVVAYIGLLVGRMADRSSSLCRWNTVDLSIATTYARQALPMVWDYAEVNPFSGGSGDIRTQLQNILGVLAHVDEAARGNPARVVRGRAQRLPLEDESVDAVVTDPPYYDNISYADLSDYFYVWHKRALGRTFPTLFATSVTPKKAEAVVAPHRHSEGKDAAARFYEKQMQAAFSEAHRVLKPAGPMVVVYAHKTTLGWSTLVDSLRNGGFQVTEAWPLSTEKPSRAAQMDTASLASSIFLVTRKREAGGSGNYATTVRPEMISIVQNRVRELMSLGIGGADLVIAAVGAGLQPYTRFDRVELPNGDELPSSRFLDEVQREVLESVLAEVFGVDRSGVGYVDRVSRFYVLSRYQYGLAPVEFGQINVLGQGLGIELVGCGSLSDGNQRLVEQKKSKIRVLDYKRGKEPGLGLPVEDASPPLIDVLHRLLWLMENDRRQIGFFLDKCQIKPSRLKLLANALKGKALSGGRDGAPRTDEQKAIDRLLAQWKRLVEGHSMPLFEQGEM